MRFSFDTSGILDAWVRHYPPDVFPSIWDRMDESAKRNDIVVSEEVFQELKRKDDGIHEWIKNRDAMIIPIDSGVQARVTEIMTRFGRLVDTRRNRSGGDPWVIALALTQGLTVVAGERPSGNLSKPKIPDVCSALGVPCIGVLDFFRLQGWRI